MSIKSLFFYSYFFVVVSLVTMLRILIFWVQKLRSYTKKLIAVMTINLSALLKI